MKLIKIQGDIYPADFIGGLQLNEDETELTVILRNNSEESITYIYDTRVTCIHEIREAVLTLQSL